MFIFFRLSEALTPLRACAGRAATIGPARFRRRYKFNSGRVISWNISDIRSRKYRIFSFFCDDYCPVTE